MGKGIQCVSNREYSALILGALLFH